MKELAGHTTIAGLTETESASAPASNGGVNTPPGQPQLTRGARFERVLEIAAEEVGQLRPRVRAVQSLAGLLPQFCFNRLRTAIWRTANVRIGEGSLVMGQITLSGLGDWSSLLTIGDSTYITGPLRIDL